MKNLIDNYYDWLKNDTLYENIGEYTKVSTPFLDRHNDCIEFYMKFNSDGNIYITDDGYILNDLKICGFEFNTHEQRKLLKDCLCSYNITLEDGNCLTITTATSDLPFRINSYIQGMLTINNFYYLYAAIEKVLVVPPEFITTNVKSKNSDKEIGLSQQGL